MKIERIYDYNISEKIINAVKNEEENLFYFVAPYTIAFTGYGNSVDKELCKSRNVVVKDLPNQGGTIVSSNGSISVGHISKDTKNKFNEGLQNALYRWLTAKGLNIVLQGNDLLVDGIYKVASYGSRRFGNILFSTFHISYEVDLDLIEKICTKPMTKIPKGLREYGISYSEMENVFLEFSKNA